MINLGKKTSCFLVGDSPFLVEKYSLSSLFLKHSIPNLSTLSIVVVKFTDFLTGEVGLV